MASQATEAMQEKIIRLLNAAERKYKAENMDARIKLLASMYATGRSQRFDASNASVNAGLMTLPIEGVHVNEVYPRVQTGMAALFARRPDIMTRTDNPDDQEAASYMEVVLNFLTRKKQYAQPLEECLFYSRLFHYGAIKLGMSKSPAMPIMTALDPRVVRVDPTTDRFRPNEARWIACKHKRSLAALYASGLYKESVLDKISASVMKRRGEAGWNPEVTEVYLWEHYFYDDDTEKNIILKTHIEGFDDVGFSDAERQWIREEDFTSVAGLPFRFLVFTPDPDRWFPLALPEFWMDQQKEINAFRNNKLAHADRAIRKMWFDRNKVDEDKDGWRLESREPMSWIPTDGSGTEAFGEIPTGTLNSDVYAGEQEAENTITKIDGIGSAQLGNQPSRGSVSATRDAITDQYLRLRTSKQQDIWEVFLESVYQGIAHFAQKHMDAKIQLAVTGRAPVTVTREMLQGQVDVILSFGSTLPRDRQKEQAEALEFWKAFGNAPQLNQVEVIRYVLRKWGDIRDLTKFINPQLLRAAQMGPPAQQEQPPVLGALAQAAEKMGLTGAAGVQQAGQQTFQQNVTPLQAAGAFRRTV